MAKKTKFPLKLKNDVDVRNLDELREHFDLEKIIGYFQDGRLLTWLKDRHYEDEAEQVENLDRTGNIGAGLCRILSVDVEDDTLDSLDAESIKTKNERIARLKQYPDGITAIDHVDCVAFNQEELNQLLENGVSEIYLCNGKFTIPIKQKNKKYIGIGKVECVIQSKKAVDFDERGILFVNVKFNEAYEEHVLSVSSNKIKNNDTTENAEKKYKYFMASCKKGWGMLDKIFGSNTYSILCSLVGNTIEFEHQYDLSVKGKILNTKNPEKGTYKIIAKLNKPMLIKKCDVMTVRLRNGVVLSFKITKLISDEEAAKRKDCCDS